MQTVTTLVATCARGVLLFSTPAAAIRRGVWAVGSPRLTQICLPEVGSKKSGPRRGCDEGQVISAENRDVRPCKLPLTRSSSVLFGLGWDRKRDAKSRWITNSRHRKTQPASDSGRRTAVHEPPQVVRRFSLVTLRLKPWKQDHRNLPKSYLACPLWICLRTRGQSKLRSHLWRDHSRGPLML